MGPYRGCDNPSTQVGCRSILVLSCSVAMGGRRVSTRVDRFDPLNFLVDKMLLCGSDSCVGLCRYIDIYVYLYKLHKGLV